MKKLWFLAILMIGSCLVACVNDDDEVKESDGDPVFVEKRLVREVSPGDSVSLTSALPFMMLDVYTMDEDRIDGVRLLPPEIQGRILCPGSPSALADTLPPLGAFVGGEN